MEIAKQIKSRLKRLGKSRFFLLIVIFFAALSFLVVVENDFDGETWDMGNALLYAEEARIKKIPLIDYLNEKFPKESFATNIYEKNVMFIPLWQSLVYSGMKLFRSISFSVRFWLALIGFTTVISLYLIGKEIYGQRTGFFAAIILAISIYYVVHVKSGFGYYALMPFLVLLLFFFFYLAHKKREKKFLYLSGVIIFLILFNGWPTMMWVIQVMGLFILFNFRWKKILQLPWSLTTIWSQSLDGKGKSQLLGLRDYLLMFLIGGTLFFIFGLLYAWYFGGPRFDVFEKIYVFWYSSRVSWFTHKMFLNSATFLANLDKMARSLFLAMPFKETDGYLTTLTTPEYAMFLPLTTFFLLVGIFMALRKRNLFDKLCLIWLVVQILGTTIFAGFTARNWLFATPCIALMTGVGLNQTIEYLRNKGGRFSLGKIIIGLIILAFVYTIFSSYRYYFFFFVKHNSFLARASQQAEVVEYVTSIASPEDSLIVLDNYHPLPKEAFYFFTTGKNYETIYYWLEAYNQMKEDSPENLAQWEQKILTQKEKIVYLLGTANYSHFQRGVKVWQPSDFSSFETLHPDLAPARVINYANNVPAIKIYLVTREQTAMKENQLELKKGAKPFFWSEREGEIDFVKMTGPVTEGKISLNDEAPIFLPTIHSGEELHFGRHQSQIKLMPLMDLETSETVIEEKKNIKISQEKESLFITTTAPTGYVVYKLKNLTPIRDVFFQIFSRINHDPEGKNRLTIQFSEDGRNYRTIYQLKSNQGKYWDWPFDKVTTLATKANSQKVYIKFLFEGKTGETEIWSNEEKPIILMAKGDGWPRELNLKKGLNQLNLEAEEEALEVSIFSDEKLNPVISLNNRSFPLAKGNYRLWMARKTPQETFEFLDFHLPEKRRFSLNQLIPREKEATLDHWLVVTNEDVYWGKNYSQEAGMVVDDRTALSGQAVFGSTRWTEAKDLINKSLQLKPGKYYLRMTAKFKSEEREEIGRMEITSVSRSQLLASLPLKGQDLQAKDTYQEFIAFFEVENPGEIVNFKIKYLGQSKLWLDTIELFSVMATVEGEELSFGTGTEIVEDKKASGGKAIYTPLGVSPVGGVIFFGGPKEKFVAGDYLAFYRMKVSRNQLKKTVIRIDNANQYFNYGFRGIWCSDFREAGQYQDFSLSLQDYSPDLILELRGIWYPRASDLWTDKIGIGKRIRDYQAESLITGETIVVDSEAVEGRAVLIRAEDEVKGKLMTGSLRNFPHQDYKVELRMKIGQKVTSQPMARLNLYQLPEGDKIISRDISRADFALPGQYQNLLVEVKEKPKEMLGFEIEFLGGADYWLDYLDFVPLD